jgi:hypothetical protein
VSTISSNTASSTGLALPFGSSIQNSARFCCCPFRSMLYSMLSPVRWLRTYWTQSVPLSTMSISSTSRGSTRRILLP